MFSNFYITDKGKNLLAKAQNGKKMLFTKIQIGNGELGEQKEENISELISLIKDIPIYECTVNSGEKTVEIDALFDNTDIEEPFYWKEIGLWAKDSEEGEILYAYGNAGDKADYINRYEVSPVEFIFSMIIKIGNADNIKAVINESKIYASKEDLEKVILRIDSLADVAKSGSYNDLTNKPEALKNPYALTVQFNGTTQKSYNGSSAQTVNITPDSIGATDTKNTAGSSNSTSKLYLIGAPSQNSSGVQTYSNSKFYTEGNNLNITQSIRLNADSAKSEGSFWLANWMYVYASTGAYYYNRFVIYDIKNDRYLLDYQTNSDTLNIGGAGENSALNLNVHGDIYENGVKLNDKYIPCFTVTSSVDWNTLSDTGIYHIKATTGTNRPNSNTNHGTLFVDSSIGTPYQLFIPDGAVSDVYKRSLSSNTWVKLNDGGNADTVDGKHASDFAPTGFGLGEGCRALSNINLNNVSGTGFFMFATDDNITNYPVVTGYTGKWWYMIQMQHNDKYKKQIAFALYNDSNFRNKSYTRLCDAGTWSPWEASL